MLLKKFQTTKNDIFSFCCYLFYTKNVIYLFVVPHFKYPLSEISTNDYC